MKKTNNTTETAINTETPKPSIPVADLGGHIALSWPHDIIEGLQKAATLTKRNDIELAILIQPGHPTRYAIRLGGSEAKWIKDINPIEVIDHLAIPAKELASRSREASELIKTYEKTVALAEEITGWNSNPQMSNLPDETLVQRYDR